MRTAGRKFLTAAAILHLMAALPASGWAEDRSPNAKAASGEKQTASEILRWMADKRLLLESGRQAWIPGGYLGPSKSWG